MAMSTERIDRGRMIADPVSTGRAVVAAEHRSDRCELQLGGDGAHRADRRVDQLDRQIDRSQEADAGDAARHPRQQPSQGASRGAGWNDDDDLGESIITLQFDDRLGHSLGDAPTRTHPSHRRRS